MAYVTAAFYGLMVLVPSADSKTADVVAVNGSFSGIPPHTVRLAIDAATIVFKTGDARPDDYSVTPDGRRFAVWNITHTEVLFLRAKDDFETADKIGDFKDDVEQPDDPDSEDKWKDLHWLANVSRISTDSAADEGRFVDPEHLRPHTHRGPDCESPTDALIRLGSGKIAVGKPKSEKLRMDPVKFSDGAEMDLKRSVSDNFRVKLDFTGAPAILLRAFGGGTRRIHLKEVNTELVVSALPSVREHEHADGKEIDHFQAYYALLNDPLRRRKPDFSRGISSTECPPAMARSAR